MAADRVMLEDVSAAVAAAFGDNYCLIWSGERQAWWRHNCQGYTVDRRMAGRYTIATAYDATSHCGPEKGIAFVKLSGEDWRRVPAQSEAIEGILARHYAGPFTVDKAVAAEIAEALGPASRCDVPQPFQERVRPWLLACFGEMIAGDREERNHRFLEEALELVQSTGCTASEAHQLVDYVFGRPAGEPAQEVGGVMVTLAALCLANGLEMHAAAETELARIWTKVEAIRVKQAAKPKHSPLPEATSCAVTGWQPVATAPRDGSWFFTKGEIDSFYPYDVARFDPELNEFVKAGCGFQYVTHWRPAEDGE